jgi:hypothetical protein
MMQNVLGIHELRTKFGKVSREETILKNEILEKLDWTWTISTSGDEV